MKSEFLEAIQNALLVNAGEDANLANLIMAIKELNPNILKSLAELKKYFKQFQNKGFHVDSIKENKIILQYAFWLEMAKKMLYEGNTPKEIMFEIGIPPEMMEGIIKQYIAKLPSSVVQFLTLLERQKRMAEDILDFFKNHVKKDIQEHDKDILDYFENQVTLNPLDRYIFEEQALEDLDDL